MTPDGSIIIGTSTSSSGTRGFRWTAAGGMVDIGALGPTSTSPLAVSDDGSVIVGNAEGSQPFIWTEEGGIVDLQSQLTALGLDLTGWRLTGVRAISADGTVIAGDGMNPRSSSEGWVAVIPEPPTGALAALAITVLMVCRPGKRHDAFGALLSCRPCRERRFALALPVGDR
jgi:probable HAF family extracellular repeat protein